MTRTKPCKERVDEHWKSRRKDFRKFIEADDYEELDQYILEVNHEEAVPAVSPKGLHLQHAPYDRILISWGGPSEEIRYYQDNSAEFVLLDWGDKAEITIAGEGAIPEDERVAEFLRSYFIDILEAGTSV